MDFKPKINRAAPARFAFMLILLCSSAPIHAQSTEWLFAKEKTIFPSNPIGGDAEFAASMSLDGDYFAVGSPNYDALGPGIGGAYVYEFSGGSWVERVTLLPPSALATHGFGGSVSLKGDTLAIGAFADNTFGPGAGACFIYVRSGNAWNLQATLYASDAAPGDQFGGVVACRGDTIAIGAPGQDDLGTDSGCAYVFTRTAGLWTEQAKLLASDGQAGDGLGSAVALEGDVVLAGAPRDGDLGVDSGSAYAFRRSGATWTQAAKFLAPDGRPDDWFGVSVALDGGSAVFGCRGLQYQAVAYCFAPAGGSWTFQAKLLPVVFPLGGLTGIDGVLVTIEGDRAVVGVPGWSPYGNNIHVGGAFVFERTGAAWQQIAVVNREPLLNDVAFGSSVALSGSRLAAGLPYEPLTPGAPFTIGAAYVYQIVPAPVSYCTAKLNSLSCAPTMDARGIPSATSPAGFQLLCTDVLNNEPGLMLYSSSGRGNFPFQGGTLCLSLPVQRTPAQNSFGNPAPAQDCSGVYSFDWSAFAAGLSGGSPSGALRVPGTRIQNQWWGRDPGFAPPFNSMLSNAIEFTVCP